MTHSLRRDPKDSLIETGLELLRAYQSRLEKGDRLTPPSLRMAIYAIDVLFQDEVDCDPSILANTNDSFSALRHSADEYERDLDMTQLRSNLAVVCEWLSIYLGARARQRKTSEVSKIDSTQSLQPDPLRIPRLIINQLRIEIGLNAA